MSSAENSFALFFCIKTTEVSCFFSRVNSLYSMEEILRALGMGTLVERFQAQRVEPETVLAASDNELVRLGVTTIGERIRIREACKKKVEADRPSTSGTAAREERSSIFNPRRHYLNRSQTRATARGSGLYLLLSYL